MSDFPDQPNIPPVSSGSSDFEPSEGWKVELRQQIEIGLAPMVDKAKHDLNVKQKGGVLTESAIQNDHRKVMDNIRKIAQEQFHIAVERERQERRWAAGQHMDPEWSEAMIREQQAILDNIKKEGPPQSTDSPPVRNEDHIGVHARAAAQRDNSATADSPVRERTSPLSTLRIFHLNYET